MSTDDFIVYDLAVLEAVNNTPFFDISSAPGEFIVEDLDIVNNITTIYLDYNVPIPLTVYNENGFEITDIDAKNSFVEWSVVFQTSP
jgi:hypothetical protein